MKKMQSLTELYKIGRGPSSSHTIGPERAALYFKQRNPDAEGFSVTLYGSLAKTGKGHMTDAVLRQTLAPVPSEIIFDLETDENSFYHPNAMDMRAFKNGEDIHTVTASQVFGVPTEQVTSEMRKRAKAVNFGIIYGIGDYSLSQDLKIPRKTAAEYIENYLSNYPGVKEYLQSAKDFARENGYAKSFFGRRRYIPELSASNKNVQAFGERVAMNMPIQGAAADLIKLAMIHADRMLREGGLSAKLILQIHDELIIDCPIEEADAAEAILREAMQNAADLKVPLAVDIGRGKNWFEAKN